MSKLKIEPELITDLYYRMGTTPPKSVDQRCFEKVLIKEAIKLGYSMREERCENMNPSRSIEHIKSEIEALQSEMVELEKLEKEKRTKSPMEEAYKKVYSTYPQYGGTEWDTTSWDAFSRGYMYVIQNVCPKTSEPNMVNCIITGPPPKEYKSWSDWYNAEGSKGIIHNVRISGIG
jgi:hypothetical protein